MRRLFFGWKTGFEPATLGTTNQCSNQLSYNHRFSECKCNGFRNCCKEKKETLAIF